MKIQLSRRPAPAFRAAAFALAVGATSLAISAGTGGAATKGGKPTAYGLNPESPVSTTATVSQKVPKGKTFLLSDIIFQDPSQDTGRVRLMRGGTTLLDLNLQHFSTQQHSLQTPIAFKSRQKIKFFIDCDNPGPGCTPGLFLSGVLKG